MAIKDLTGKRFGKFLVLRQDLKQVVYPSGRKQYRWICRCDCGNEVSILGLHLPNGHSTQCRKCKDIAHRKENSALRCSFYCAKSRAKRDGKIFTLKYSETEELFKQQNGKCAISGVELIVAKTILEHKKGCSTISLDRIDSSKGYEPGNVQWVHKVVNWMKHELSSSEFMTWCKIIVNNNVSIN